LAAELGVFFSTPSVIIGSPGSMPVISDNLRATRTASFATNPIWHNTAFRSGGAGFISVTGVSFFKYQMGF
jgi:hypothetical protein